MTFDDLLKANPKPEDVVICSPKTVTCIITQSKGFYSRYYSLVEYFTVIFRDWNEELGSYALVPDAEQRVKGGEAATPPTRQVRVESVSRIGIRIPGNHSRCYNYCYVRARKIPMPTS